DHLVVDRVLRAGHDGSPDVAGDPAVWPDHHGDRRADAGRRRPADARPRRDPAHVGRRVVPLNYRVTFDGAVGARLRSAAARGLLLGAEHVLGEAERLVPLDEGALQHTGTASVDEQSLTAMVSYDI